VYRATFVGSFLWLAATGATVDGHAASYRLTDAEGVTHFTNAPTDPRYRSMPGMSGTGAGWLRLPPGVQARFTEEIKEIAGRHGVSASLVESVIRVESAFNPGAISRKGAQGLMQLMPQTASSLGVRNAFDPKQNIEGGVRHLRYLIDRYPGNLPLAVAAYNAGEGAVDRYRGIPPYAETQDYVRKVLQLNGGGGGLSQVIYRFEDSKGTVTYTNVPPASRFRVR
jgi:soluble lytic murein transglycosylase-like protein